VVAAPAAEGLADGSVAEGSPTRHLTSTAAPIKPASLPTIDGNWTRSGSPAEAKSSIAASACAEPSKAIRMFMAVLMNDTTDCVALVA
jgi:hypothetical protein